MKIKTFIAGLLSGGLILLLILWMFGFRKHEDGSGLMDPQRVPRKVDISWFLQIEGYPELAYKDPDLAEALNEPERVSVFRVKDSGDLKIGSYRLDSMTEASKDDTKLFSTLVCSPTSMTGLSACEFSPGFAIQFSNGPNSFYALVCFSCSDLMFYNSEGEEVNGWGMTSEAEYVLIERFRKLFPNDSEVQSLKLK
jgi:hypothetical protein